MLPSDPLFQALFPAAEVLRQGGIVALPTESSYGLAVDIHNEDALHRLYQLKRRPADKPLLVLVNGRDDLADLVREIPPEYEQLMAKFWPGPLTLIFPAHPLVNTIITGGTGTIGIRHSPHQLAAGLVNIFGSPITATSANRSGELPCTDAGQVKTALGAGVDMVIDGGVAAGKPSTIVSITQHKLKVLREGQLPATLFTRQPGIH